MGVPKEPTPVAGSASMCSCRALYIGSAPTNPHLKGTDALQDPLRARYPGVLENVEGIDSMVSVSQECLEMKYSSTGKVIQFPMDGLAICAAVRAIEGTDATSGEARRMFVPVDQIKSDATHPAIFAAIIRRNDDQTPECHMYLCNTSREALHLVNTAASVSMALKKAKRQKLAMGSNGQVPVDDDIRVVPTEFVYTGGEEQRFAPAPDTIYVKNDIKTTKPDIHVVRDYGATAPVNRAEPSRYSFQQTLEADEASTIYIKFDKSNLIQTDDNTMQVVSSSRSRSRTPEPVVQRTEPMIIEKPVYYDVAPPPQPKPYVIDLPKYVNRPPPPLPRPPPVLIRPRPALPPQVMYAPPMMVRPQMFPRYPPPPARLYSQRRVLPPPPQHFVTIPPPLRARRPRSASPGYGRIPAKSEMRQSRYQPKWGKPPGAASDVGDFNRSRRFMDGQPNPPRDFRRNENMFLNERAFARHVHNDERISDMRIPKAHHPQHYPTAYELHDQMLFDRGTTKSNPRYSSSSDE